MPKITTKSLRKFNLIMAVLHGLQALVIMLISTDFKLPVTGAYLSFNQPTQSLEPASQILFELPLTWLIAGFFLLSAGAHLPSCRNEQGHQKTKCGFEAGHFPVLCSWLTTVQQLCW